MMIDMSELEGKSFSCIEGCGMCCLCQPELADEEIKVFETDEYLRNGLTKEHVNGRRSSRPNAIRLQGNHGACYFLKNRRCTINEMKPRFCRQFPIHIHVLRRMQINVNLSCRGVDNDSGSMKNYAKKLIASLPGEHIAKELAVAKKVAHEFENSCQRAGIHQPPERLRSVAMRLLPLLGTEEGIARILAYSDEEPEIGSIAEEDIVSAIGATAPADDLDQIARESNYDIFKMDDIARLPVYVDEGLRWIIFQSAERRLKCALLEEDGRLSELSAFDAEDISLLPRSPEALGAFADYAGLLISRDPFMGYAASICDFHDYRHDMMVVYLGTLGTCLLDLWWRTSLIGALRGEKRIDALLAREGIRAYDMDCLDAPTIGSFI